MRVFGLFISLIAYQSLKINHQRMQVIGSLISVRPSSFADSQDTHFNTFEGKSYEYRITDR